MRTHKHPKSYYQTMALLLGGAYDDVDHTIMMPSPHYPHDGVQEFSYEGFFSPETGEYVSCKNPMVWSVNGQKYRDWLYPPEVSDENSQ